VLARGPLARKGVETMGTKALARRYNGGLLTETELAALPRVTGGVAQRAVERTPPRNALAVTGLIAGAALGGAGGAQSGGAAGAVGWGLLAAAGLGLLGAWLDSL